MHGTELASLKISMATAMILVVLIVFPVLSQDSTILPEKQSSFIVADSGLLPALDYVWQEINGFCAWAATAMAMQYAGVDLTLHDVFAASTVGFSFAYFRFDDTWLMFPGTLYTQAEPTHFLAELYGVNYTIYLGDTTPNLEQNVQVWESEGLTVGVLDGQTEAFDLMRQTIDSGYPLLISVDPARLPAYDYDYLRNLGAEGGAHGVLIVGYNDSETSVTIVDPGVGSFGENFGFPDDGRGNYTTITYTALIDAWSERHYISNTFLPKETPSEPVADRLGPLIRDKLLGVGTVYSPNSPNAYVGKFGQNAFREMSQDIKIDGLKTFLAQFDGVDDEINFKASLLYFIGLGLEIQTTLQYLSYRTALKSLPTLMPETDLTTFIAAGEEAIPAFENLVDNSSLIFPGNISQATGFLATTFLDLALSFNASGDIDATLTPYEATLNSISANLLTIAESWQAAGDALAEIWPNDFFTQYGVVIILAGGVGALVVIVLYWTSRKESQ